MRAVFEHSRSARIAVVVLAAVTVLALVRGAAADDDFGLRRFLFGDDPVVAAQPPAAVPVHRRARRIWAASRSRPLRIALGHTPRRAATASAPRRSRIVRVRPSAEPQVVFPKLAILPKPARPALVSLYRDGTLRNGDAVMMADGIHVFHGGGVWPFRPRDFVRLNAVVALDWHLRQTLNDLDRNPPVRWSGRDATAG